uniref:Uncharacterized protein n=1 Tax=Glossina palpalis gambiensis TaxID=67801 RepID=A0A1B0B3X6_9MUSC
MLKSFKSYQVFFLHFLFVQAIWAEVSEEEEEEVLSHPIEKVWDRTQLQAEIEAINTKLQMAEQEIMESTEGLRNMFNTVQNWAIRTQANVVDYAITVCKSKVAEEAKAAFTPESPTESANEQQGTLDVVQRLKVKLKEAYESALNEVNKMAN